MNTNNELAQALREAYERSKGEPDCWERVADTARCLAVIDSTNSGGPVFPTWDKSPHGLSWSARHDYLKLARKGGRNLTMTGLIGFRAVANEEEEAGFWVSVRRPYRGTLLYDGISSFEEAARIAEQLAAELLA